MDHSLKSLSDRMAEAARALQDQDNPLHTMETAAQLAVDNIEHCQAASISLARRGRQIETPGGTSEAVRTADQLQAETAEGPCVDAIWEEQTVSCPDLTRDERWPTWGRRVSEETGLRSVLAFQLFTTKDTVGALNMYSDEPRAFDGDDHAEGQALAAHIAIAVSAAQRVEHLLTSQDSRTVIGQATGILMERYGLDPARAWAVLTRVSSTSEIKIRDLALRLVETGRLPDTTVPGD